ncbi:6951_t:CDS:1 [Paraglomus occultum]|uniref:6951_t:CDS:1 n=1 Tax=Paraglomus occultum TaxID=144539 RepID=A0A9N8VXA7_9GLOM|nr:6951_t:CDS:1 [Paraglomus occultum]
MDNQVNITALNEFVNLLLEHVNEPPKKYGMYPEYLTFTYKNIQGQKRKSLTLEYDGPNVSNLFGTTGYIGYASGFSSLRAEEKATVALLALLNPNFFKAKLIQAKKFYAEETIKLNKTDLAVFFRQE